MFKRPMTTDILCFCQTGFLELSTGTCPSLWRSVQMSTVGLPGSMDSNQGRVKGQEGPGQAWAPGYILPQLTPFEGITGEMQKHF